MPAPIASPTSDHPYRGAEVVTRDGRSLPLVSARLRAEARGGIARLVLEQRFENSYDEPLHVTYRMPLPAEGAVSGYAFELAGRTVRGRVERRAEAREQFEQAIASGKTAALLEQDRADIFTQSIGNLPGRSGLTARITIDQPLIWLPEGEWELRFPTVIGPRYLGTTETAADAEATALVTALDGVAPRIQLAVHIGDAIAGGRGASSPSHALRSGPDGALELRDLAGAALDRDIVVRWPVAAAEVGVSLAVARPPELDARDALAAPHAGDHVAGTFGLLTIVPPARAVRATPLARDMIILLDTSGSMAGGPLDKAKQVLGLLIESLGDADRLELIAFSSAPRRFKPDAVHATRGERAAALDWLRGQRAGGGTEMRSAVIEAMRALRPGSQRQVVLATDGYIGGEEQIVRQLHRELPRSCRLHFVGVGSAVNRTLSTAMARAGRGTEVLCGLDEDADRAAGRLIARTRMPVLTEVALSGSALIDQAPALLPDVFEGAPFVAAVQLQPGELIVRGDTAHGVWEQRVQVRACRAGEGHQAIVQLYGRERVADLESRTFGGDMVNAEIEAIGIAFQIATRLTSWIAIDDARRAFGPARHEDMPQALPYGTTAAAFGLRAGASPAMNASFGQGYPQVMASMSLAPSTLLGASPPAPMSRARRVSAPVPVMQSRSAMAPGSSPPAGPRKMRLGAPDERLEMRGPDEVFGMRVEAASSSPPEVTGGVRRSRSRGRALALALLLALLLALAIWWLVA
ncbi:MAG TPA: VIT domain-containing protein [Kofleriaceae bacterium]|nr:VIT domain-containing protein [Kofleriaceae bacterium]